MSIKKARETLQNKEKFNYDILDKVANSGGAAGAVRGNKKDSGRRRQGETAGGDNKKDGGRKPGSGRKKERKLANRPKIC